MEKAFDQYEVWFVTGAQLLYGGDAVIAVDAHSNEMVNGLNESVGDVYLALAREAYEQAVVKLPNNHVLERRLNTLKSLETAR